MTSPYSVEVTSVVEIPTTVTVMDNTVTQIDVVELGVIGPQGIQGVQGAQGPQGSPGLVNSVTAGDNTITIGGTAYDPTVVVNGANVAAASATFASFVNSTGISGLIEDTQLASGVTITGAANKILKTSSTGTIDADIDAGSSTVTTNKIQFRKDFFTNWAINNPTLANGEIGYDTTNGLFKIGDGTALWNDLLYSNDVSKLSGVAKLASANAFTVGGHTIVSSSAVVPLTLTAQSGGSTNAFEVYDNSATRKFFLNQFGNATFSGSLNSGNNATFTPNSASTVPLKVQGAASQTADLQQWQNSAGTVIASVTTTGLSMVSGNKIVSRSSATTAAINIGSTGAGNPSSLSGGDLWGTGTSLQSLVYNTGSLGAKTIAYADSTNWTPISTTFTNATTTVVPLTVKGAASQTANLQEWQNSAGSILALVSAFGSGAFGGNNALSSSLGVQTAGSATQIGITVRGATSQTANLQQWQNSAATTLTAITSAGALNFASGNTSTTATAGAITAPALVTGFISMQIAGTTVKVPYYSN
jgi:hypothetical protein